MSSIIDSRVRSKRTPAVALAALALVGGSVALSTPAQAASAAQPVAHECDVAHITPGSHVYIQMANNDSGLCFTGQGTAAAKDIMNQSAWQATDLKPAHGKLLKVHVEYTTALGEHLSKDLTQQGQVFRFPGFSLLTKVVIG